LLDRERTAQFFPRRRTVEPSPLRDTLGAIIALVILAALIIGPAYVAVTTEPNVSVDQPRCEAGDIGCEIDRPRRPPSGG
jgi:hypothetical protein